MNANARAKRPDNGRKGSQVPPGNPGHSVLGRGKSGEEGNQIERRPGPAEIRFQFISLFAPEWLGRVGCCGGVKYCRPVSIFCVLNVLC